MEIQTFHLESWMCRMCLAKGTYDIFKHHLLPPPFQQQQQNTLKVETVQGQHSVAIVDALNYFSEFKISPTEITNEPIMLCESCCAELLQCYQFRIKLNEAECLLRRDTFNQDLESELDVDAEEDTKTGLTLQLTDIEPFLEDFEPASEPTDSLKTEPSSLTTESSSKPKIHHAKPRFELTSKVSNILRHVASSSTEKRKDLDDLPEPTTPSKIPRHSSNAEKPLDRTLVVPNYIFATEIDGQQQQQTQLKTVLLVGKSVVTENRPIPSDSDVADRTESSVEDDGVGVFGGQVFYCKHCPKAFSAPFHLLAHTKSAHLCQHCLRHLPDAQTRNRHVREAHKTFRCSLCSSFQSPYAANLRAHLRRTHAVALPAHVSILQQQEVKGK